LPVAAKKVFVQQPRCLGLTLQFSKLHSRTLSPRRGPTQVAQGLLQRPLLGPSDFDLVDQGLDNTPGFLLDACLNVLALGAYVDHLRMPITIARRHFGLAAPQGRDLSSQVTQKGRTLDVPEPFRTSRPCCLQT